MGSSERKARSLMIETRLRRTTSSNDEQSGDDDGPHRGTTDEICVRGTTQPSRGGTSPSVAPFSCQEWGTGPWHSVSVPRLYGWAHGLPRLLSTGRMCFVATDGRSCPPGHPKYSAGVGVLQARPHQHSVQQDRHSYCSAYRCCTRKPCPRSTSPLGLYYCLSRRYSDTHPGRTAVLVAAVFCKYF